MNKIRQQSNKIAKFILAGIALMILAITMIWRAIFPMCVSCSDPEPGLRDYGPTDNFFPHDSEVDHFASVEIVAIPLIDLYFDCKASLWLDRTNSRLTAIPGLQLNAYGSGLAPYRLPLIFDYG